MKSKDQQLLEEAYKSINEQEGSPFGALASTLPHLDRAFEEVYSIGTNGNEASEEQINAVAERAIASGWGLEDRKAVQCLKYLLFTLNQLGLREFGIND
jgi:hypothetical protein